MADQNGRGIPLTGKAVYDEELLGGSEPITGFAAVAQDVEEDELDEREAAVARWERLPGPPRLLGPLLGRPAP